MELIIGGAYQGKLDYAAEKYGLKAEEVFECSGGSDISAGFRAYNHFEKYLWYCCKNDIDPVLDYPEGTVIIMNDIFCGVVPVDRDIRAWREFCGRAGGTLTRNACSVTRIFCGLPQKLK